MLQILNSKERNQAFLQFLLFFLVTTGLIVGAVYFNFAVPETEKNYLREEVKRSRADLTQQQNFIANMLEAKKFLDSLNKPGVNTEMINSELTERITGMNKTRFPDDTSSYGKLNNAVITAYIDIQASKKQLNTLDDKDRQLLDLKEEVNGYIQKLTLCQGANRIQQ